MRSGPLNLPFIVTALYAKRVNECLKINCTVVLHSVEAIRGDIGSVDVQIIVANATTLRRNEGKGGEDHSQ